MRLDGFDDERAILCFQPVIHNISANREDGVMCVGKKTDSTNKHTTRFITLEHLIQDIGLISETNWTGEYFDADMTHNKTPAVKIR